ncbi:MAG TPA: short-chain dehydrogenase [Gemmatimonadota bacterium]|nr:short-chain dehydrogenase [Gemmatimonadota bacterium]
MELKDRTVLILGGWGLVGSAIARAVLPESPAALIVHSLRREEADEAVAALTQQFPALAGRIAPAWGNIFVRSELKDHDRSELLARRETRRMIVDDTMQDLTDDIVRESYLYRLLVEHCPEVVVDCINTATAFAYQDVFYSVRRVRKVVAQVDAGEAGAAALRDVIEDHLTTLSLPQLIRHVQIVREALRAAGARIYLKVGTTGSGGMGLNIPYTHSEERPSRVLLSKSSIAGAHSMLLYLLARTPGAPVVKEIKPSAAIAWKEIGAGPIERRGRPIELYDCSPDRALGVADSLSDDAGGWHPLRDPDGKPRVLESVYIDTGENGVFSCEEFETVTALGQMEFVTPEEIAADALIEIRGGTTGREVIAALDGGTLGPTYRAGVLRHRAIETMRRMEADHEHDSVAFEMLGPPRLSKLLFEAYLLKRTAGSLSAVAEGDPGSMSAACARLVVEDPEIRARILSVGIPIRLPDGRLLRGPEMKTPPYKEEAREELAPAAVERWADAGWVDLRTPNLGRWRDRARAILDEMQALPAGDTSSARFQDRAYWAAESDLPVGRVAAWILGVEEKGARGKAV